MNDKASWAEEANQVSCRIPVYSIVQDSRGCYGIKKDPGSVQRGQGS